MQALQRSVGNQLTNRLLAGITATPTPVIRRDTTQTVDNATYDTETFDTVKERPKKVVSQPKSLSTAGRGPTPAPIGGALPLGFDGGHILGLSLGGQNSSYNVVPMLPGFNRRVWKALEDRVQNDALWAYSGRNFNVTMNLGYPGPLQPIPTSIAVTGAYDEPKKKGPGTVRKVVNYGTFTQPGDIPVVPALTGKDRLTVRNGPKSGALAKAVDHLRTVELNDDAADYLETHQHLAPSDRAQYPDSPANRPYENLDILTFAGESPVSTFFGTGALFTNEQRKWIIQTNKARNGGHIVSDDPHDPTLVAPHNLPYLNEQGSVNAPEIDHIIPKSSGGSNFFSNARIVSWLLNNKDDRVKNISNLVDLKKLAFPAFPTSGTLAQKIDDFLPRFITKLSDDFTEQSLFRDISINYTSIILTANLQQAIRLKLAALVADGTLTKAGLDYSIA